MNAVGIDVSKGKSTVAIYRPGNVVVQAPRDYRHTESSINDLITTIKCLEGETKVCMEHTGRYYEPMASWLSAAGIFVSTVNPWLIKDFGNESIRTPKTDKADAFRIAIYCSLFHESMKPSKLPSAAYFKLKSDAASLARAFRMSFDDDVTGITTVISDEPTTASGTYTLDGRRIEGQPTQKGVYIVNGKKVVK